MEIKIHCAHKDVLTIQELKSKFHPENPNEHSDEQIDRIAKILKAQGIRKPVTISLRSGFITAGHGRVLGAERAGLKTFPVDYQEYESEELEYADLTADNAVASWAELDLASINAKIPDLGPDFDIDLLGIESFVLEPAEKLEPGCDEDEVPEDVEPKTKLGDIYQLGNHRLMCGDSTSIDAVEKLMNGEKAEMGFTDPPYGVNYDGGIQFTANGVKKGQRKRLENDDSSDIYSDVLPILAQTVVGPIYTWYAASQGRDLYNAIFDLDADYHAMIVWVKDGGYGALNAAYKQKHEPCVFWKPKGSTLRWCGPTTENTIWEMKKDKVNKLHPTQKPVELAERALNNHDAISVIDLFGGSGSTLIACEKTNRKCFMMELDPHYCDVIVARWEKYTGKKAVLLSSETVEA